MSGDSGGFVTAPPTDDQEQQLDAAVAWCRDHDLPWATCQGGCGRTLARVRVERDFPVTIGANGPVCGRCDGERLPLPPAPSPCTSQTTRGGAGEGEERHGDNDGTAGPQWQTAGSEGETIMARTRIDWRTPGIYGEKALWEQAQEIYEATPGTTWVDVAEALSERLGRKIQGGSVQKIVKLALAAEEESEEEENVFSDGGENEPGPEDLPLPPGGNGDDVQAGAPGLRDNGGEECVFELRRPGMHLRITNDDEILQLGRLIALAIQALSPLPRGHEVERLVALYDEDPFDEGDGPADRFGSLTSGARDHHARAAPLPPHRNGDRVPLRHQRPRRRGPADRARPLERRGGAGGSSTRRRPL